jgi:type I restriction enzyme, S subunit
MTFESKKLGSLVINLDNKRIPLNQKQRAEITKNKLYPYIGANNILCYVDEYIFDEEILCVAEDGGSWGRSQECAFIYNEKCWVNNHAHVLRSNGTSYLPYLRFYLNSANLNSHITGTTRGKLTRKALDFINIPIPENYDDQVRIAGILSRAEALIEKRKESIQLLDEFLKSTFLEMFGDPVRNEKGWSFVSLAGFGSFKNGLNYGRNEIGVKVRILGVGDFKSRSRINDVGSLSTINLSTSPSNDFFLQNGDIVFVRSNGNRQIVGRCLAIYPNDEKITFSGFCIRYRIEMNKMNPTYLTHLFRIETFRLYLLQSGRGANIQNINQKILSELKIPMPLLKLQNQFSAIVDKVETMKAKYQVSLEELEGLYGALSQRAFKGELDLSGVVGDKIKELNG